ncbi:hypothetical protein OS493_015352 [Desmophyllum pertusum]|uniref:Uncharacterized protein n=1 Tax=Desmophyllum pertusum TaxID=174260 RepID=A0A9X0CXU6_9CNID|nr:hypothetical protein OS493_015352 [Desmophyllum pertusum]
MDLEVSPELKTYVVQRSRRSTERNEESTRSRIRSDEDSSLQGDDHVTGTIGAFSQELDSLTHMLTEERHNASNGSYEV